MTEKIARRGIQTPHAYEPDILDKVLVKHVLRENRTVISGEASIEEARNFLVKRKDQQQNYYVVTDEKAVFKGIISASNLFSMHHPVQARVDSLIKRKPFAINTDDSLKTAVEMMARENLDVLPVVSSDDAKLAGILSYQDILKAYRHNQNEHETSVAIPIKRKTLKMLVHGKKRLAVLRRS